MPVFTKCDFCHISRNINGKLVCPYAECLLSFELILEIMDRIAKMKGGAE